MPSNSPTDPAENREGNATDAAVEELLEMLSEYEDEPEEHEDASGKIASYIEDHMLSSGTAIATKYKKLRIYASQQAEKGDNEALRVLQSDPLDERDPAHQGQGSDC